jgi:elongation factor Ts
MEITAKMVMDLREQTGLPMMDCKKALTEAKGDVAAAVDLLRKSGAGKMEKLAGRETSQGRIGVCIDTAAKRAGIVELRCETAPVANTDDFLALVNLLAKTAAKMENPTPETLLEQPNPAGGKVIDLWHGVVNKLRENMQLSRVASLQGELGSYIHFDGQSAAVIELTGPCPDDLKSGVCMHVVSMRPPYLRREDVDPATVAKEREILKAQVPADKAKMADKIVEGKLNRWFGESCLLEQPYVKDDKQTVGQVLKAVNPALTIKRFVRFRVGGG